MPAPSYQTIEQALATVARVAKRTPLIRSRTFSEMTGTDLRLKLENLQATGSFKIRGACSKIAMLSSEEKARGVVCASAGNHAQGVAFAASAEGVRSTVFMPAFASVSKIQATRSYGAEVVLEGGTYDEASAAAAEHAGQTGKVLVPAFDDEHVISGQGTIGVEMHAQCPGVGVVVVPVGGGGLIAGIALAIKHLAPAAEVIGVEAEGAQSMKLSVEQGRIVPLTSLSTIADGIAVKTPGRLTFPLIQQHVDRIVTVNDEEMANALFLLGQRAKLIAEPAGAAGLAALLAGKVACSGRTVVAVVSGGNLDFALLGQIVERGMLKAGLRARIGVAVPDKPGMLNSLLDILTKLKANVESIAHQRDLASVPVGHVLITITFRTLGPEQVRAVEEALHAQDLSYTLLS